MGLCLSLKKKSTLGNDNNTAHAIAKEETRNVSFDCVTRVQKHSMSKAKQQKVDRKQQEDVLHISNHKIKQQNYPARFAELREVLSHFLKFKQLLPPTLIINDRYRLNRVIIESLFGFVIEAYDLVSKQLVCIKLSSSIIAQTGLTARGDPVSDNVRREAAILRYIHKTAPFSDRVNNPFIPISHIPSLTSVPSSSLITSLVNDVDLSTNSCRRNRQISFHSQHNQSIQKNDLLSPDLVVELIEPTVADHIIKLLDDFDVLDYHCLVFPYFSGGDLFNLSSKQGPMTSKRAKHFIKQLALTLYYLHEVKHVAHLDVSLENICIQEDRIVLIDFGSAAIHPLAKESATDELRSYRSSVIPSPNINDIHSFLCLPGARRPGKRQYISPEAYSGECFDAYKVDVWALGVIMYSILTGRPPFEIPHATDAWFSFIVLRKQWLTPKGRSKPNSFVYNSVDEEALHLIDSILCSEADRPSISQVLAHPWFRDM